MAIEEALDPRLVVVSARAPFRLGAGFAWYDMSQVGKPDQETFDISLQQLREFIDDLPAAYQIDPERLYLLGLVRSVVPLSILIFLAFGILTIGRSPGQRVLWWAVAGNAFGYLLQGAIFWTWWRRQPSRPVCGETLGAIRESLAWRRTRIMGLAWLCNLAFNTVDVLMLGLMSNPEQIGLYGAAYRVLNQVLVTYYLLTQVLYPRFARHGVEDRARMLRSRRGRDVTLILVTMVAVLPQIMRVWLLPTDNDRAWQMFSPFALVWAGGALGRAAQQVSGWSHEVREMFEGALARTRDARRRRAAAAKLAAETAAEAAAVAPPAVVPDRPSAVAEPVVEPIAEPPVVDQVQRV